MRTDWVRYDGAKKISPTLAYMEREDPSGGIVASTNIYFFHGKLGMMGNFVGWRNERGCTRYVEYLPDGTYQALNKDARV